MPLYKTYHNQWRYKCNTQTHIQNNTFMSAGYKILHDIDIGENWDMLGKMSQWKPCSTQITVIETEHVAICETVFSSKKLTMKSNPVVLLEGTDHLEIF